MTNLDLLEKLHYFHKKWYWANRELAEVLKEAAYEIETLRKTNKNFCSILDNPNTGVNGWGKGSDE